MTAFCVCAFFVWHAYLEASYRRVLKIGYGIVPLLGVWVYLLSTYQTIREMSALGQMANNGKQIGLGMTIFYEEKQTASLRYRRCAGLSLLSCALVLVLISMRCHFTRIDLKRSWDSPHNLPFVEKMPNIYASSLFQVQPGNTPWQGFVGPGTAFEPGGGLNFTLRFSGWHEQYHPDRGSKPSGALVQARGYPVRTGYSVAGSRGEISKEWARAVLLSRS